MVYVYCPRPDPGVRLLAAKLGATILRRFDGMHLWLKRERLELVPGDRIVCLGDTLPQIDEAKILNQADTPKNKLEWLKLVSQWGYYTFPIYQKMVRDGLGRSFKAYGGRDLIDGVTKPDYWTAKYNFDEEYKVHIINHEVVKVGLRVPKWDVAKEGEWAEGLSHPWVRTSYGGWDIDYVEKDLPTSTTRVMEAACKHIPADFCVVDVGVGNGSSYAYVTDISLQPDLSQQVIFDLYVKHIRDWIGV